MRTRRFVAFAAVLLLMALAPAFTTAAADQHSGTWKMNPDKPQLRLRRVASARNLSRVPLFARVIPGFDSAS